MSIRQPREKQRTFALFREVRQNRISLDIISQIREAILNGTLKPGDRLPPEKVLVSNFGVSKHTLREALRALEVMGFLEVRKGACGGPVVLEVDMKTTRESIENFLYFQHISVRDLSEVRKFIEPHLARLAAERMSLEELDELAAIHHNCMAATAKGDLTDAHDMAFHNAIARASKNPVFIMIQDFVNSMLADTKHHLKPSLDFLREVHEAHDRILQALRDRDLERVATEMHSHVCAVEESLEGLQVQRNEELKSRLRNDKE